MTTDTRHTAPAVKPRTLSTPDAARYCGVSEPYLKQARIYGDRDGRTAGPPWIKIGRSVRYLIADLDAWLLAQRRTHNKFGRVA